MTAFPGAGDAVDRIGGRTVLEGHLRELRPGQAVEVGVEDTPRHYVLGLFDGDGKLLVELRSCQIATSRAVSSEQLDLMVGDMKELRRVVAEILSELEEDRIPESEKRALDGDR